MPTAERATLTPADIRSLFADLADYPALVLAVSGGPDSTALLVMAARWRKTLKRGPNLVAVTVDHGLRPEARREATAVGRLARTLGVKHRTLRWIGRKPGTGLQQAARLARYRLLAEAARQAGAGHVLTAHTLDDQAETVLFRLIRGSGIGGLAAMARISPMPEGGTVRLVRPLLGLPKDRLLAVLRGARVSYADDPSNRDPRFTRVRLREAMPVLRQEGLDARRLAVLADRARRADAALEQAVDQAMAGLVRRPPVRPVAELDAASFAALPEEIALRLLGRMIACEGNEGPVELRKLEALHAGLIGVADAARFRRTLAGAIVTRRNGRICVETAPARRAVASNRP